MCVPMPLSHSDMPALIQKGLSESVQLNFYASFVDEGREGPNTTKSGPSSACKRNVRHLMAFRWRAIKWPNIL